MFLLKKFLGDDYERVNHIIDSYNNIQNNYINLEACCSYPFPNVLKAQEYPMFTLPTEGMVNSRFFPNFDSMDDIDNYTEELVLNLLHITEYDYNVCNQPHSGTQANQIVYNAILKDGDKILSLDPKSGGHISHNKFSKNIKVINYGLTPEHLIDYNKIEDLANFYKPKLIIVGASSYPNDINYKKIAQIAHNNGSYIMVDACHTILYIMAGLYSNPFPDVDFVTFSLEKVLRGPQGGILIYRKQFNRSIAYSVFPLTQGGPLQSVQFAKLLCFVELERLNLKKYALDVQQHAKIIGNKLKDNGINIYSTDYKTHILLVDVTPFGLTGAEAEQLFYNNHMLVNKNQIPKDKLPPQIASGIRFGTTCISNLAYTAEDTEFLGNLIAELLLYKKIEIPSLKKLINKYHSHINISN